VTLSRTSRALEVAAVCIVLLVLWQAAASWIGGATLPGPMPTGRRLFALLFDGRFQRDLAATAGAYVVALVLTMAGGLLLGIVCGGWRSVGEQIEPALLALIATPKVMFYPVILLFFGLGDSAKIFFGMLHGLPTIVIMIANALRSLPPIYRKVALTLKLSRHQFAVHVLIPAVLPEVVASLRVSFALTLLGVLVGEMFASTRGLGHLLFASIGTNDQPTILAVTVLLFAFAGIGSTLLLALSRKLASASPIS